MLKKLRKRFIFFNMLTISCLLCILAFLIYLGSRNNRSATSYIALILLILPIVYAGSSAISKFALLPIKRSWQKQLDFTADASHELRTPLAVIRTNLEIVMDNPNGTVESQMKWLKNIEIEHMRMAKLVDDLLTLSRADTSEQSLFKTTFLLDVSIQKVIETFQPVCEQKEIVLTYEIEPHISLIGDESRITQLIVILLDNAFQYTKSGGNITLMLHRKAKELELTVQDTGVGISKEDIDKIFDRFYRVANTRQQNPDGSGLGLSIAKWIVVQHNGSIHAESTLGRGTTFFVNFQTN
jgi:signal transduction histidine kinase